MTINLYESLCSYKKGVQFSWSLASLCLPLLPLLLLCVCVSVYRCVGVGM